MSNEKVLAQVATAGIGAAAGVVSGLKNAAAPHLSGRMGAFNVPANFTNGMTKAMRQHKGFSAVVGAGAAAAIPHGAAIAAVAIAAAPAVAVTAAAGAAIIGACKLVQYFRDK